MPIPFACPYCGVETDVAEQYAGRSGPCARCGKTITVPSVAEEPPGAAAKTGPGVLIAVIVGLGILGGAIAFGAILLALLLPAVQSARAAARKSQCAGNLRQIATAVFEYRQRYDTFPPAYIADKNGRPMHSWRVLILPFLGEQVLYERYNFDQPWDSPDNQALASQIPQIYRCPEDPAGRSSDTSYLMIVGPRTFSTVTGPRRLGEFPDGAVKTLMLVETLGSGINWTEPRDLQVEQMSFQINAPVGKALSSNHPGGAHAAMCDGSVLFLSEWTTAEQVRAMTTIDGGEVTGPKQ
jgi:prepilin-type processing-associated H-X9-DG protein